ncbi:hypothetical protein [Lawsonibacter asaccharolyticus]
MNTLNYRTGKKYPGDRTDYYGFLAYQRDSNHKMTAKGAYPL